MSDITIQTTLKDNKREKQDSTERSVDFEKTRITLEYLCPVVFNSAMTRIIERDGKSYQVEIHTKTTVTRI